MTILIDIGNTRAKVARYSDGEFSFIAKGADLDWKTILAGASTVLISNVASSQPALEEAPAGKDVKRMSWDSPELSKWMKDVPHGMGADRVAADVGARSLFSDTPLLIIDAGTCLTFDMIDADGTFLGGSISPGVDLRLKSMHDHTAALPLFNSVGESPILGYNTETAMRGGAVNGMRWEIEGYIHTMLRSYPTLHVLFTGGSTNDFPSDLRPLITIDPFLVHRGLLATFQPLNS